MRLSVCPHDMVKQLQSWLTFAAYLQKVLDEPVTLEPVTDFTTFYERALPQAELAFVNPLDAWHLHSERGFTPLCGTEAPDEVVFIAHPDDEEATLKDFAGQVIAAVERQFATALGLYVLCERGIEVDGIRPFPSWVQVIQAVVRCQVRFGLLYQDFYAGLSRLTRRQFRVVYESHTGYATHMLLLHPDCAAERERLMAALTAMPQDAEGATILAALRVGRWVPAEDLGLIAQVLSAADEQREPCVSQALTHPRQ